MGFIVNMDETRSKELVLLTFDEQDPTTGFNLVEIPNAINQNSEEL